LTAFAFSQAHVALYKKYSRCGARRRGAKQILDRYRGVLLGGLRMAHLSKERRIGWAFETGVVLGCAVGSLRYRTLYL
jgi:hypothetical protein